MFGGRGREAPTVEFRLYLGFSLSSKPYTLSSLFSGFRVVVELCLD